METKKNSSSWFSIFFVLIIFFILGTVGLQKQTDTNDEHLHYRYGVSVWNLNTTRTLESQSMMPFSALNLIPLKLGEKIQQVTGVPTVFLRSKAAAKSMTVLFSMMVACFVYLWSFKLYGKSAAFFSLLFYAFCPNIIAYSRLITVDLFACGMIYISFFFFWRALNHQTLKHWLQSATAVGVSLLAKYTCLFLFPIFFFISLVSKAPLVFQTGEEKRKLFGSFIKKGATLSTLYLIIAIFILNVGFLFNKPFSPLGTYSFGNTRNVKRLERYIPFLKSVPLPTPHPYLEGLYLVKEMERKHTGYDPPYLLGKVNAKGGFKSYFFYVFLYKVPLAMQIILFLALLHYVLNFEKFYFFRNEVFIFVPIIFYMVYLNFLLKAQLGIRYLLPVLPLIHTFSGSLFVNWKEWRPAYKLTLLGLIAFYVISVLSYSPHFLAYFNELVGDRKKAYKILAESNLDWGQSKWYLEEYMKRNPDAIYAPDRPMSGKIVISANQLSGAAGGVSPEAYRWLRENFEPVGHIAYCYLIYRVDAETLQKMGQHGA